MRGAQAHCQQACRIWAPLRRTMEADERHVTTLLLKFAWTIYMREHSRPFPGEIDPHDPRAGNRSNLLKSSLLKNRLHLICFVLHQYTNDNPKGLEWMQPSDGMTKDARALKCGNCHHNHEGSRCVKTGDLQAKGRIQYTGTTLEVQGMANLESLFQRVIGPFHFFPASSTEADHP